MNAADVFKLVNILTEEMMSDADQEELSELTDQIEKSGELMLTVDAITKIKDHERGYATAIACGMTATSGRLFPAEDLIEDQQVMDMVRREIEAEEDTEFARRYSMIMAMSLGMFVGRRT
jgi:hypothetical protein